MILHQKPGFFGPRSTGLLSICHKWSTRGARIFLLSFGHFLKNFNKNWEKIGKGAHTVRIFLVMMVIQAAFLSDGDETQILGK